MSPSDSPSPNGARWRRYALYAVLVALANTAIAALLTELMPEVAGFGVNFVFSQAIGLSILTLMVGTTFAVWRDAQPPPMQGLLVMVGATAAGFVGGSELASRLLGRPSLLFEMLLPERLLPLIIGLTILTSLGCSLFFWTRERVASLELAAAQERERAEAGLARAEVASRLATQAQLDLLRAQLEPHMLFNTLANIRSLMAIDPPRAQRMMDRLIAFLRATLSASRSDAVSLSAEFGLLRDYLELIAIRMGSRLSYRLDLPAELEDVAVLPLLLQPLVENAVRHGLEPAIDGGRIEISARSEGDRMHLIVEDTGLGFRHGRRGAAAAEGFGLGQTRDRLRAAYGDAATLSIESPRARLTRSADQRVLPGAEPPVDAASVGKPGPGTRLVVTMPRRRLDQRRAA